MSYKSGSNRARNFKLASQFSLVRFEITHAKTSELYNTRSNYYYLLRSKFQYTYKPSKVTWLKRGGQQSSWADVRWEIIRRNPPWTWLLKMFHSIPDRLKLNFYAEKLASEENILIHLFLIDRLESSDKGLSRPGQASQKRVQTSTVENETSDLTNSQVGSHSK